MTGTSSSTAADEPLSAENEEILVAAIVKAFIQQPPTIGLIGASGTGKSSTINAMFKTDLPVSHVVACTKEFRDSELRASVTTGQASGTDVVLRVVDAPGLGEDVKLDAKYLAMYAEHLPRCDVILWVMTARNRAIALDQRYLAELGPFADRMVFGINQVDLVDPIDWQQRINLPSTAQEASIELIQADRKTRIEETIGRSAAFIPYSARHKWQLQELFTALVEAAPAQRTWMFNAIKAFRHDDFLPVAVREQVMEMAEGTETAMRAKWFRRR